MRTLGADVVTGGTVKYLLGSAGLGFMWLRGSLHHELLPTQTGWFADEDIFEMSIADYSPHASARRFDSGTPPVPSLYPGVAGMELIADVGVPTIEAHVAGLVDRLFAGLDEIGATTATPRSERRARPARLRRLDRPAMRSSTPSPPSTSSPRPATRACESRSTSTTSRTTSTGSSRCWPRTGHCSPERPKAAVARAAVSLRPGEPRARTRRRRRPPVRGRAARACGARGSRAS